MQIKIHFFQQLKTGELQTEFFFSLEIKSFHEKASLTSRAILRPHINFLKNHQKRGNDVISNLSETQKRSVSPVFVELLRNKKACQLYNYINRKTEGNYF